MLSSSGADIVPAADVVEMFGEAPCNQRKSN
jgi:hypothetical protein